jgi:hypothetical protein
MTFSAAVLAIESLALMSQQFLHFSESTGELFLQQKFPGESGFVCPVASRNAPLNSSKAPATSAASVFKQSGLIGAGNQAGAAGRRRC